MSLSIHYVVAHEFADFRLHFRPRRLVVFHALRRFAKCQCQRMIVSGRRIAIALRKGTNGRAKQTESDLYC